MKQLEPIKLDPIFTAIVALILAMAPVFVIAAAAHK
jgi:hypothetical protein